MATANFSGDEKQKAFIQQLCWEGLTAAAEIHGQLTFLSAVNIFLSLTAVLGNALILVALCKESSLHPPSKLLLRNLAVSDLCVGLISEPLTVTYWMSELNGHWNICRYVWAAGYITSIFFCEVSLLTLTAVSVDRLLALLLGLRYKQVVTLKRTYMVVITFWAVSPAIATMYFWNFLIALWYAIAVVLLCLVTSIFSYTKILFSLLRYQAQVQNQPQEPSQANPLNIARYKKAVSNALWLQLTLVACYLPHVVVTALWTNNELFQSVFLATKYTISLVFLNSSLNPIIYCWRIEEVRQAVKDTIRQALCCSSC